MAGHGKGSADVMLAAAAEAEGHTVLTCVARAQVGGKMAQVGSRLIDAAAAKITEDFFAAFEAQVAPPPAEGAAAEAEAAPAAGGGKLVWWIVAAVVLVVAIWWLKR